MGCSSSSSVEQIAAQETSVNSDAGSPPTSPNLGPMPDQQCPILENEMAEREAAHRRSSRAHRGRTPRDSLSEGHADVTSSAVAQTSDSPDAQL